MKLLLALFVLYVALLVVACATCDRGTGVNEGSPQPSKDAHEAGHDFHRLGVPAPVPRPHPTAASRSRSLAGSGTGRPLRWHALAMCESTDNPRAVSPGGTYRGLYQFNLTTWLSVGGHGDPAAATRAEQTRRAQLLYASRGRRPWPRCGRLL